MRVFFEYKTPYALGKGSLLKLPIVKRKTYGIYYLKFRASFSCNNLPEYVKASLSIFKERL